MFFQLHDIVYIKSDPAVLPVIIITARYIMSAHDMRDGYSTHFVCLCVTSHFLLPSLYRARFATDCVRDRETSETIHLLKGSVIILTVYMYIMFFS